MSTETLRIVAEDIQFTSVRFSYGLATYALTNGVSKDDAGHFAKMVKSQARKAIVADQTTYVEIESEKGVKTKTVKEDKVKSRISGSGLTTKLTIGSNRSAFIGESVSADLVRLDQLFTTAEKFGIGVDWTPVPDSHIAKYLATKLTEFKANAIEAAKRAAQVATPVSA